MHTAPILIVAVMAACCHPEPLPMQVQVNDHALVQSKVEGVGQSEVDSISLKIDSDVCADAAPFLLLVVMFSHAGDSAERALVRDAYPVAEIAALGVRRVFVLGALSEGHEPNARFRGITDQELLDEAAAEHDMIQFDFIEDTNKLSLKSYLGFRWALQRCGRAAFVAKADDDTFLEYYSIGKLLSGVRSDGRHVIRGALYTYFLQGGFYVLPTPALRRLVAAARPLRYMHSDDLFFTGQLANQVGMRRVDVAGIRPWTWGATCCRGLGNDSRVFACDRFVFLLDAGQWRRQAAGFKAHGRHCYEQRCEKYSPAAASAAGVRCNND